MKEERGGKSKPQTGLSENKKSTAAAAVSQMIKARKIVNNTHCSNKLLRENLAFKGRERERENGKKSEVTKQMNAKKLNSFAGNTNE